MDSIREDCFSSLLQETEECKYDFGEINSARESYWMDTVLDYGVEVYDIEDVHDLQEKIENITGINEKSAKCIAISAVRESFQLSDRMNDAEIQQMKLPEFVYRM